MKAALLPNLFSPDQPEPTQKIIKAKRMKSCVICFIDKQEMNKMSCFVGCHGLIFTHIRRQCETNETFCSK